jgi:hypothetical protein
MNAKPKKPVPKPIIFREGSSLVKVYPTVNRIYRTNPDTGERELKSSHEQFTLAYYSGSKRIKLKFSDRTKAETEARLAVVKLANGESEALKLTGSDRGDYIKASTSSAILRACHKKPSVMLLTNFSSQSATRAPATPTPRCRAVRGSDNIRRPRKPF